MIVFVIAMESEARPVIDKMQNAVESVVHERKVVRGKLCGKDTAVIVCGVGKTNAAAGTQYAVDCLGADKIINVGFAGGLNGGTEVGSVYCISRAAQYDFDLAAINGTPVGTLNEYAEPYMELGACPLYPAKKLATGDRFNDSIEDFKFLTETLGADIRDMEGGAVAHVCKRAGVPCYSFKVISDVAGSGSTTEQFLQNIALCAQALGENIIKIFEAVNG
ncbi:MAG: 5'-methylthioadenosine/S-adenosylhomocysteine nucleosidase [Clostridia bacterium]|nr:5'-methylthioadenosine/S-adenosylhomocysteine nucleosidase [Clostridia bacterium]